MKIGPLPLPDPKFMNSLKRKLNGLFKENLRLRQDYLKHRLK